MMNSMGNEVVIALDELKESGILVETIVSNEPTEMPLDINPVVEKPKRRRRKKEEAAPKNNHCPACLLGQDAAKGEGTHLLLTIEHPYDPPATVVAPDKPAKRSSRPMAKELRGAHSFAEKMLPKKIAEKAKLMGQLARCEAEIQELVRVIQALGGQFPAGMPAPSFAEIQTQYQPTSQEPYNPLNPQHNPTLNFRTPQIPSLPVALRGGAVGSFNVNEVLAGPVPLDDGLPEGEWK